MNNYYEANYLIKKGGYKNYKLYISAKNKNEAREKFDKYRDERGYTAHAFHIEIRRIKDDEILDYAIMMIC